MKKKKLNKKLSKAVAACESCAKKYKKLEEKYSKLKEAYSALKDSDKKKKKAKKSEKSSSEKAKKKAPKAIKPKEPSKSAKATPQVKPKVAKAPVKKKVSAAKTKPVAKPKPIAKAPKAPAVKKAPAPKKVAPVKKTAKPAAKSPKPSETQILAKIKKNAASVNFGRIGKATASKKDDLKKIKGIGPFLENRLNTLGIFQFLQISKFTKEDEETVNAAIEYFPGRIVRDDWVKQAKAILAAS